MALKCTDQKLEEVQYKDGEVSFSFGKVMCEVRVRWEGLTSLDLSGNLLRKLPALPSRLEVLRCENNFLSYLPELPQSMRVIGAAHNHLSRLPDLPKGIESVNLLDNPFTASPFRTRPRLPPKPVVVLETRDRTQPAFDMVFLVFMFLWLDRFWMSMPGPGRPLEGVFLGRLGF